MRTEFQFKGFKPSEKIKNAAYETLEFIQELAPRGAVVLGSLTAVPIPVPSAHSVPPDAIPIAAAALTTPLTQYECKLMVPMRGGPITVQTVDGHPLDCLQRAEDLISHKLQRRRLEATA